MMIHLYCCSTCSNICCNEYNLALVDRFDSWSATIISLRSLRILLRSTRFYNRRKKCKVNHANWCSHFMNKPRLIKLHPTTPIPPKETQIGKPCLSFFFSFSHVPWPNDSSSSNFRCRHMFRMDSNINKPIDYFLLILFRQGRRDSSKGLEEIIDRKRTRNHHHQRKSAEGCCAISDGWGNLDSETGLAPVSSLGVVSVVFNS